MKEIQIRKVEDLKKKNDPRNDEGGTVSVIDEKRQYLIDELSELMDQASENYGPFLMKELQRRLEVVVQNFNEELNALIKSSFDNWKIKDSKLRDIIARNLQAQKTSIEKENPEDSSTPEFIKDVKFGPIHRK